MQKFLYKALVVVALVAAIDLAVGWVSNRIFTRLDDRISQIGAIEQALLQKTADVVVLGSSCAKYNYDPRVFADTLQMTVQNTGVGGMNIIYSKIVLQAYLERCTPKCAIIDVYGQMNPGEGRVPRLKPFYGLSNAVTSYYDTESDWQQRLKLRSNLYRCNGTMDLLLRHNFNAPDTTCGFAFHEGVVEHFDTITVHEFQPDTVKARHLRDLVTLCHEKNIMPVFVISPRRVHDVDQEAWLIAACNELGAVLINEMHTPVYYDTPGLFFDESHLNGHGAEIFSRRVASQLRQILSAHQSGKASYATDVESPQ